MNITVKVMTISMFTNVMLAILKIIIGLIGSSSALIADGLHSFSDLITDVCAIIGSKLSRKPADLKHPYGHGKLEYLTSVIIGLVVVILGLTIVYNSVNRGVIIPSIIVVIVSLITILSKLLLSTYVIKMGKKHKSNILISSGYESSADVISSIVVLISALLMQLADKIKWLGYSDIVATIIVGILIIRIGFNILKENISTMLGEQETDEEYIDKIKRIILDFDKVKTIDELVLLKYGPYYKLIGEISMSSKETLKVVHKTLDKIERNIKNADEKIKYVTIHVNPYKKVDNQNS